ncbi:MAG: hypothetical protein CMI63_03260 [Parvularcula sp.]|nr:hypothetical protein [Parvularcula sp.]
MRGSRLARPWLDRIGAEGHIGALGGEKNWKILTMTMLEKAVQNLAEAIEALETRLDLRLEAADGSNETAAAARRQAAAARKQAGHAAQGVAAAISDLKAILAEDDRKREEAS